MENGLQRSAQRSVGKDRKRSDRSTFRAVEVMAFRRKHDIVAIVALVLAVIGDGSLRSEFRLQPDMPPEFFDGSPLPPAKRASEQKVAAAYWACAVKQAQWKYGYASRLPVDPPPELTASSCKLGLVANDEAVSRQYWL